MGKLAGKDMNWLLDAKQQYEEGMPAVTDPKRRELIQIGLDAVLEEIKLRSQKKTDVPLVARQEPPPEKKQVQPVEPSQKREVPPIQEAKPVQQERQGQVQPERISPPQQQGPDPLKPKPVLISSDVLTKVPPPTISVKWASGKVKQMTELELKRQAVDYFKDVLDSKFDASDFNQSAQFNNCVRFLIGLYRFGNDILPHLTLHSTFNSCGEVMKAKSIELYRQIETNWTKFKDEKI